MIEDEGLTVQEIAPLELLHRAAEYVGAVVCLTSSADVRGVFDGRKPCTLLEGATLRLLAVVRPVPVVSLTRWRRLERGKTLASCDVSTMAIDTAALQLVEQLHKLMQRRAV